MRGFGVLVCVCVCVCLRLRAGARGCHTWSVGEQQREASHRAGALLFSWPGRAGSYISSLVDYFFMARAGIRFDPERKVTYRAGRLLFFWQASSYISTLKEK